jgi:hypothetical protein
MVSRGKGNVVMVMERVEETVVVRGSICLSELYERQG